MADREEYVPILELQRKEREYQRRINAEFGMLFEKVEKEMHKKSQQGV